MLPVCSGALPNLEKTRYFMPLECQRSLGSVSPRAVTITLQAAWQPQVPNFSLSFNNNLLLRRCRLPTVICSNGAQKVAPNKLLCFHNTAAETRGLNGFVCLFHGR